MRQVSRTALPNRVSNYLTRKQSEVDAGANAQTTWNNARRTMTMRSVAQILATMSGRRQRCMFCGDSRSTDVEHFWPKSHFRARVFRWDNMLWICSGCNRQKGNRLQLDGNRKPLLIDPSAENPWEFLYFDSLTGNITARYDPATGQPNPKGAHTTDPRTLPLNIEAVTEGRQRTRRNLVRAVKDFLRRSASEISSTLENEFLEAIHDNDDYGLVVWYFRMDGGAEEPFQSLRASHGSVWAKINRSV